MRTENARAVPPMSSWHRAWAQAGLEVETFLNEVGALPVSSPTSPDEVRHAIESRFDFGEPVPLAADSARVNVIR